MKDGDLNITVPETYRTAGVPNTDLLIFVRSSENDPDGCSEGTLAYALHTEQDTTLERPTFGVIDMCIAHNKNVDSGNIWSLFRS